MTDDEFRDALAAVGWAMRRSEHRADSGTWMSSAGCADTAVEGHGSTLAEARAEVMAAVGERERLRLPAPDPRPPAHAPAPSSDAFEADWAGRAGMTVQRLRSTGMRPRRCEGCNKDGCRGWRMDVPVAPHDGSPGVFHY